jgi:hypothetical protein
MMPQSLYQNRQRSIDPNFTSFPSDSEAPPNLKTENKKAVESGSDENRGSRPPQRWSRQNAGRHGSLILIKKRFLGKTPSVIATSSERF